MNTAVQFRQKGAIKKTPPNRRELIQTKEDSLFSRSSYSHDFEALNREPSRTLPILH